MSTANLSGHWNDYAIQRMALARQAAASGRLDEAAREFEIALGFVKSPSALLELAELHFSLGNYESAYARACAGLAHINEHGDAEGVRTSLEQCKFRAHGAKNTVENLAPFNSALSAVVFVRAKDPSEVLRRIVNAGTVSTDGVTVGGHGAIFEISIEPARPGERQASLDTYENMLALGYLDRSAFKAVKERNYSLRISGPASSIAQSFPNQQAFAKSFLRTTSALMDAVGGQLIWSFHSGLLLDADEWRRCAQSGYTFNALVMMGFSEQDAYSFGMHSIGYADVRVQAPMNASNYREIIQEFARFQALNYNKLPPQCNFYSVVHDRTFIAQWRKCEFSDVNPYFWNPNGMWALI
ncbi:MAG: hypothetical protein U0105_23030 [Candidatus Obscuribacterales bacterium]